MTPTHVAFLLVAGHFAVDYPLQGDTTAIQKSPHTDNALSKIVPWYYWLFAHAIMHGAVVLLLTQSLVFGILETVAHGGIDYLKCDRRISIHTDQALHLVCKATWFYLWWRFGAP